MEPRRFFLDTQARQFVASPDSTLAVSQPVFFQEDVEAINLYFLKPTGDVNRPFDYIDYSANSVKMAVGLTNAAALQTSWAALSTSVTTSITTLTNGGSGAVEVQSITLSQKPSAGGFAIQLPARNITVSSVSAGVFTCSNPHGLYDGQQVTLSNFTISGSTFSNSSYYVVSRSNTTFGIAAAPGAARITAAATTSGGGTAALAAITTGQIAYNATPSDVQQALVSAGLQIGGVAQLFVTGTVGVEYTITYANGSAGINFDPLVVVGSTLSAPAGLTANLNLNTTGISSLIASGATSVKMEVEAGDGTVRQTYQQAAILSDDIVSSTSPTPLPNGSQGYTMLSPDNSQWVITVDNNGVLTATKA